MSDPTAERGPDDHLQPDPARRAHPERVIPSERAGSGVRARPHGVRATPPPATPTVRPNPHPRNRRAQVSKPLAIGLPAFRLPALSRGSLRRPSLRRPTWPLSGRQTLSIGIGLATVIAVVAGLVLLIPSKPIAPPITGSVRSVDLRVSSTPPTGNFYYGPYFVDRESELLVMGSDGNTSTVWASSDGSAWTRVSDPGSFGAPNQRFVVLGFADDGQGGLSAVGSGFAPGAKVVATAWHSRDGRTWTPAAVDFPTNTQMIGLASRPGAVVSAGNGVAWYSADGTSWAVEALPNATGYVPRAVRAWAGGFAIVAVSTGTAARHTKAWVSTDGKLWNEAASPLAGFEVQDLVAYGNGLVAVGSQILTPAELATPTPVPTPTPTPTPTASALAKTPKPTVKPKGSPTPSAGPSASPSPTPTPPPVEVAISWISADGINWFRGATPVDRKTPSIASVTQVYDSLVAVGSEPGAIGGGTAPAQPLSLWTSDDGTTWKPIPTNAAGISRGRLTQFGHQLVLAGAESGGTLAVMAGDVGLGSPLPLVAVTPPPAFMLALKAGTAPIIPGLKADDVLGPVVATAKQFLVFINGTAGTTVWASADGKVWAKQADPAAFLAAAPGGGPSPADASGGASPAASDAVPTVSAAVPDGQGGVIAVGTIAGSDSAVGAIWTLKGSTWTPATISVSGGAPSSLGSVEAYQGNYVAAASSEDGPRLLFSGDGQNWDQAAISGADGRMLTVSSWSGGFIATGPDIGGSANPGDSATPEAASTPNSSAPLGVWTSADGLTWVSQSDWKLPAKTAFVYGARKNLLATTTGLTTAVSWWWSADGSTWKDPKLATTGGCWAAIDAGFVSVSAPAAGTNGTWRLVASKDGQAWQAPGGSSISFGGPSTACGVASIGDRVVVVGWSKEGVLQDLYGDLTGL